MAYKGKQTVGEKNLNPLNIKGKAWEGAKGVDAQGHAVFDDPSWAFRAAARQLQRYALRGKLSLSDIIQTWAPYMNEDPGKSANDPVKYAKTVGGWLRSENPGEFPGLGGSVDVKHKGKVMGQSEESEDLGIYDSEGNVLRPDLLVKLFDAMLRYEVRPGYSREFGTEHPGAIRGGIAKFLASANQGRFNTGEEGSYSPSEETKGFYQEFIAGTLDANRDGGYLPGNLPPGSVTERVMAALTNGEPERPSHKKSEKLKETRPVDRDLAALSNMGRNKGGM